MKPLVTRNIILIRHGQYNMKGTNDKEKCLTELGKQQAIYTGIRLNELGLGSKLNFVMKSTQMRARETSDLVCMQLGSGIPVHETDVLREGLPVYPDPPFKDWRMPDAERVTKDRKRMDEAFDQIFHRAAPDLDHDTYELYICHGNLIRYLVYKSLQFPVEAIHRSRLRHCSITWVTIRPSGNVSLKCFGDTGHIPPQKLTFE